MPQPTDAPTYSERLWAPPWLWLVAALWPLMLGIAYGYALGPEVGIAVTLLLTVLVVAGLFKVSAQIELTPVGLHVGRAFLETEYLGSIAPSIPSELGKRWGRTQMRELSWQRVGGSASPYW